MNFPSKVFFYNINHGLRAATLKKNSLWLLLFYIAVATYSYNEKVCRTMRNATVSCIHEKLSHIPKSLIANYKFFIRPHLDYCYIWPTNFFFFFWTNTEWCCSCHYCCNKRNSSNQATKWTGTWIIKI